MDGNFNENSFLLIDSEDPTNRKMKQREREREKEREKKGESERSQRDEKEKRNLNARLHHYLIPTRDVNKPMRLTEMIERRRRRNLLLLPTEGLIKLS